MQVSRMVVTQPPELTSSKGLVVQDQHNNGSERVEYLGMSNNIIFEAVWPFQVNRA